MQKGFNACQMPHSLMCNQLIAIIALFSTNCSVLLLCTFTVYVTLDRKQLMTLLLALKLMSSQFALFLALLKNFGIAKVF